MTMASKYHLTIRERYEDHSEDEFTGGSAVFSGDYEHKLDLDTAKTGETIRCITRISPSPSLPAARRSSGIRSTPARKP